jgi:lipopolysaccharide transport system permease protein
MATSMNTTTSPHLARAWTSEFRRYADLTHALAMREFVGRYRGNLSGGLSAIAVPLMMLATYTFVFSVLLPGRVRPGHSATDFGFFLFAGLVAWNLFSELVSRGPRLFADSPQYVRKPQFPISVLVAAPCLAGFYRSLPWAAAFAIAGFALGETPPATAWLTPLALLLTALLTAGFGLMLASLGVLIRDLNDLVPAALTLGFFLSPILYPTEVLTSVSPWLRTLNPLASHLTIARGLLFDGVLPDPALVLEATLWTAASLFMGIALYRATRTSLQDLL